MTDKKETLLDINSIVRGIEVMKESGLRETVKKKSEKTFDVGHRKKIVKKME